MIPNFKSNDALKDFIEKNPDRIDEYNDKNMTLLSSAIEDRKNDIAEYLLNKGADVGKKNGDDSTPLTLAIKCQNYEMLELLTTKGIDPNRCADPNQFGIQQSTL